jgi:hypothetical protein
MSGNSAQGYTATHTCVKHRDTLCNIQRCSITHVLHTVIHCHTCVHCHKCVHTGIHGHTCVHTGIQGHTCVTHRDTLAHMCTHKYTLSHMCTHRDTLPHMCTHRDTLPHMCYTQRYTATHVLHTGIPCHTCVTHILAIRLKQIVHNQSNQQFLPNLKV